MDKKIKFLGNRLGFGQNYDGAVFDTTGISPTILARDYKGAKEIIEIKRLTGCMEKIKSLRAEQSRAEQSRAEQSRAEQSRAA